MNPMLRSGTRYLLLGGLSSALTVGLTVWLHEWVGLAEELAVPATYGVVLLNNFLWFRYFVFDAQHHPVGRQATRFVLSSLGFRGVEYAGFLALHTWLGWPYLPVLIGLLVLSTVVKFVAFGGWIFARRSVREAPLP
jgi:putative flippase GtrA